MSASERIIEGLPEEMQKRLQAYTKEVKAAFGDRLEGLLLYGSAVRGEFLQGRSNLNLLFFVSNYDSSTLKLYEPIHKRWSKEQVVTPLFLTDQELRSSSALFPIEFLEIQEHHRVLGGRDPFVGFHVDTRRLRDAVIQGLAGNLLRLRQRFVEGGGANDAVIKDIADRLQLDLQGLLDALLLKRGQITPGPSEIPRLFDRYLQAYTALAQAVQS